MSCYKPTRRAAVMLAIFLLAGCNQSSKPREEKNDSASTVKPIEPTTDTMVTPSAPAEADSTGELSFLKAMNGKYPADVKLLENPVLATRLKTLLGDRYTFLKETWAVETPIEVNNNIFVAGGCMAHNCGSTNFIIVADLLRDKLYAGIREDDIAKKYGENPEYPQPLRDWEAGN